MKRPMIRRLAASALALPMLLSTGCATSDAFRDAIAERDERISQLEAEKAELQRDRQSLYEQLDTLALENQRKAAAPQPVAPIPAAAPKTDRNGIEYGYRNGQPVITIPSSVTFGSGKATLSKDGEQALREVAQVLRREHSGRVYSIEGHTDTDPIKKSKFATNRDLSLARAMAVLTFLVEDCRIPDDHCVIVGHGQYVPLERGNSADAKRRNRRVEIVVHGKKQ